MLFSHHHAQCSRTPVLHINCWKLCLQRPGHCHLVQRDHHPPDDVQHLRVPGRPGVSAAGEIQGSAHVLCSLPDPQHLFPLLGVGTLPHTRANRHSCDCQPQLKGFLELRVVDAHFYIKVFFFFSLCRRTWDGSTRTVLFGQMVFRLFLSSREQVIYLREQGDLLKLVCLWQLHFYHRLLLSVNSGRVVLLLIQAHSGVHGGPEALWGLPVAAWCLCQSSSVKRGPFWEKEPA